MTGFERVLVLAACAVIGVCPSVPAKTFLVGSGQGGGTASFTSDAPVQLIVGNTSKVSGKVSIDDSLDLKKPVQARFDVDLASIDTGIALRNEHMRDNFLETAKYPKATFVLKKLINPPVLKPGEKAKMQAEGDFTIHGKTVPKTVAVEVAYVKDCGKEKMEGCEHLQIKATFPVPFKDHDIKRPEIVFKKLADTVFVNLAATAYIQQAKASAAPASK